MRKPNFFIIGAPKCGTTSLAAWLAAHSNIYISSLKEPMWFLDNPRRRNIHSWRAYERLFQDVEPSHIAIGEASTSYLHDQNAVNNVLNYAPNAKFIVMLRNPVEMAPSLHEQQVFNGEEHLLDFDEAWAMQDERRLGRNISRLCRDYRKLVYGDRCKLGEQLGRVMAQVDPQRLQVLFLDDVKKNPRREYLKVLGFLSVPDDGREDFPVKNQAKERRSRSLGAMVMLVGSAKRKLGIDRGTGLLRAIDRKNQRNRTRSPLTPERRSELQAYFRDDIRKLEQLTGRDLSGWLAARVTEDE